jgi:translation elongation factor EF-Ts
MQEKLYLNAYGEGVITMDQYKEQISEIKEKKALLQKNLMNSEDPESVLPDLNSINLKALCDKIALFLQDASFEKKQLIVRKVVESVTTDSISAKVKGYIPLAISEEITQQNVKFKPIHRYCGSPQCRKINII